MDETLSSQQFADLVGVSRRTVQRWAQQGLIFAVLIDGVLRIPIDEQPPSFYRQQDLTNSEVQPLQAIVDPALAGFPTEEPRRGFSPEEIDDLEEDEEEEDDKDCRDAAEFDIADLRKAYASRDEAEAYAGDIPVPTEVFKRCSDGFFQVAITY